MPSEPTSSKPPTHHLPRRVRLVKIVEKDGRNFLVCSCQRHSQFRLPCSHIIAVNGYDVKLEDVGAQWLSTWFIRLFDMHIDKLATEATIGPVLRVDPAVHLPQGKSPLKRRHNPTSNATSPHVQDCEDPLPMGSSPCHEYADADVTSWTILDAPCECPDVGKGTPWQNMNDAFRLASEGASESPEIMLQIRDLCIAVHRSTKAKARAAKRHKTG